MPNTEPFCVAALYHFTRFADHESLKDGLAAFCEEAGAKGTLLLASEGINGTIAASDEGIAKVVDYIAKLPGCADVAIKYSRAATMPFIRMKVRLKKEIVTMGQPDIDPNHIVGTYVEPEDWNDLILDPDTILIDTRNDYEVAIGTFEGAIDPKTQNFRDFPQWFRDNRGELLDGTNKPKVAMFCTGGIRCEKSTAFLKGEGIEEVYHLKGGILKYLEDIPKEESTWEGECFVFDDRVSLKHGLELGEHTQCRACRHPLTKEERGSKHFLEGISCPHCHDKQTPEQRKRYAERQKQTELAKERGEAHVGAKQDELRAERQAEKLAAKEAAREAAKDRNA